MEVSPRTKCFCKLIACAALAVVRLRGEQPAAVSAGHDEDCGQRDCAIESAGDRQHSGRDVRHAGQAVRAAGNGPRRAEADDGGRPRVERPSTAGSTACTAAIAPTATASPATATARRPRSSIPIRATTAPASSSSRARTRRPADRRRPAHDRSRRHPRHGDAVVRAVCRRTKSTRWSST